MDVIANAKVIVKVLGFSFIRNFLQKSAAPLRVVIRVSIQIRSVLAFKPSIEVLMKEL
jgi:hypothetical protein